MSDDPSQDPKVYFIDPQTGDDRRPGNSRQQAWQSFAPLNRLTLQPGDRVTILPGAHHHTLMPVAQGSAEKPVEIRFAPGRHDFFPDRQHRQAFFISNCNGDPAGRKAIAIYLRDCRHVRITGDEAALFMRGKMMEFVADHSGDITVTGLTFDYHRPTVSEFTVTDVADGCTEVRIHPDSAYRIDHGQLLWVGEGWTETGGLRQTADPPKRTVRRGGPDPFDGVERADEAAPGVVRLIRKGKASLTVGTVFQYRNPHRDYCSFFLNRSRDLVFRHVNVHFMHGMGVIGQFSENLTFEHCRFAPRPQSGRTCAAWADILHFSGCRGTIRVDDVHFSGAQDDAINVHGTYLRIVEALDANRLKLRYMHKQTFGFAPCAPGDQLEFTRSTSLLPFGAGTVRSVERLSDHDWLCTLADDLPNDIHPGDVVENTTWTPDVQVRNCLVEMIPTRGFLLTTRGKVVVERNRFQRTHMSAILVAGDACSWFESGSVRDLLIRHNHFDHCAEPVIHIHPENAQPDPHTPIHRNIRIVDNHFQMTGQRMVSAASVGGLVVKHNTVAPGPADGSFIQLDHCFDADIEEPTRRSSSQ